MPKDSIQSMIERYKRELMEYEKRRPQPVGPAAPRPPMPPIPPMPPVAPPPPQPPFFRPAPPRPPFFRPTPPKPQPRAVSEDLPEEAQAVAEEAEMPAVPVDAPLAEETVAVDVPVEEAPVSVDAPVDDSAVPTAAPVQDALPVQNGMRMSAEEEGFQSNGDKYPPYGNPDNSYNSYEELLQANPKTGFLRVQTFAGNRVYPVGNARVTVVKRLGNEDYTFYDTQTDASGVIYGLTLPAPDRSLAAYPTAMMPYETYNVWVEHPNFYKAMFLDVLIFDGIETALQVELIPSGSGNDGGEDILKIYDKDGMTDYVIE